MHLLRAYLSLNPFLMLHLNILTLNLSLTAGHIRPAFIFLGVLVALPIPMIWIIDVKKGQEDAARMADVLKRLGASHNLDTGVALDEQEAEGLMQNHGGERY